MSHEPQPKLVVVERGAPQGALLAAVEEALGSAQPPVVMLPALTNVALGDPFLAQQLADLHRDWEVRPLPAQGMLRRIRTRLAWWLLGPEIQQVNAVHATSVRLIDSLVVQLDQERAARRRIEEQLAYDPPQP